MLHNLNKQQIQAVKYCDGPLLILAGAGSGKTKTLTTKIAYLIKEKNIEPSRIVAMTFTNKAAKEMLDRVDKLLLQENIYLKKNNVPLISTFHSFCAYFLRNEIHNIGFKKNFIILDTEDSISIIRNIMHKLKIDTKDINPKKVFKKISEIKNKIVNNINNEGVCNNTDPFIKQIMEIYGHYKEELFKSNACDFDDLLIYTVNILDKYPDVAQKYYNYYKYVLVDEYQDTNSLQYRIIIHLTKNDNMICVVGDDDQSIYKFRGADIKNILNFEKDFKNLKVIKLEQNYRSTKLILDIANSIIKNNFKRREKKLWSNIETVEKAKLFVCIDEKDESYQVCKEINNLLQKGIKLKDIVILYRINAQSRALEEALLKFNIPYKIVGGLRFYERKEIKDIIAYLRIILNPNDDISLYRIINVPHRGISTNFIKELITYDDTNMYANINDINILNVNKKSLISKIYSYTLDPHANKKRVLAIKNFFEIYKKIFNYALHNKLSDLIDFIIKLTKYRELELDSLDDSDSRWENINELITVAKKYDINDIDSGIFDNNKYLQALNDFLTEITLINDIDNKDFNDNSITLMTIHSAKGLEFENVFIIGLEENIFPSYMSLNNHDDIEEERRLMYVAVTRAKKRLYMFLASMRNFMGITKSNKPSRFIYEIPSKYIDNINNVNLYITDESDYIHYDYDYDYDRDFNNTKNDLNILFSNISLKDKYIQQTNNEKIFKVGDVVMDKKFGVGKIIYINGDIANIDFKNYGKKTILLSISNISKIT